MAKLKQGILGGISGKIGNLVGSSWKGIPVIKTLPLSVANPRTTAQVAQRTRMTNTVAFAQDILSVIIKPLWDRFAHKMSGYNDFISTNIQWFDSPLPSPASALVVSKGKMMSTAITDVTHATGVSAIVVEWGVGMTGPFMSPTDMPYILFINETKGKIKGNLGEDPRSSGYSDTMLPCATEVGDVIHIYLSFKRADGTIVSNNSYKEFVVTS